MCTGVVDCLLCRVEFGVSAKGVTGVGVAVKAREIGRGDFQANTVPFEKNIARYAEVDFELVDFVRFEHLRVGKAIAVAGPEDAIAQIFGVTVRRYVHQFAGPVGIGRLSGGVKDQLDGAGYLQIRLQGAAGITQYVVAHLDRALVIGPPGNDMR